eukprot:m.238660 g.238660  ORF g.238660 m.238660 type:complete len:486 (+) comp13337_c0_seq1:157-1614(+)
MSLDPRVMEGFPLGLARPDGPAPDEDLEPMPIGVESAPPPESGVVFAHPLSASQATQDTMPGLFQKLSGGQGDPGPCAALIDPPVAFVSRPPAPATSAPSTAKYASFTIKKMAQPNPSAPASCEGRILVCGVDKAGATTIRKLLLTMRLTTTPDETPSVDACELEEPGLSVPETQRSQSFVTGSLIVCDTHLPHTAFHPSLAAPTRVPDTLGLHASAPTLRALEAAADSTPTMSPARSSAPAAASALAAAGPRPSPAPVDPEAPRLPWGFMALVDLCALHYFVSTLPPDLVVVAHRYKAHFPRQHVRLLETLFCDTAVVIVVTHAPDVMTITRAEYLQTLASCPELHTLITTRGLAVHFAPLVGDESGAGIRRAEVRDKIIRAAREAASPLTRMARRQPPSLPIDTCKIVGAAYGMPGEDHEGLTAAIAGLGVPDPAPQQWIVGGSGRRKRVCVQLKCSHTVSADFAVHGAVFCRRCDEYVLPQV